MAQPLLPVEDARARILASLHTTPAETVPLSTAFGRVLAEEAIARRTQPPADLSAMDGYAVKAADVTSVPASLKVVGEAPAGGSYADELKSGEAIRIFTGAPLPRGADTIIIQEVTTRDGDTVTVAEAARKGQHVRTCGLDFRTGDAGMPPGRKLSPADIAFAAAMNLSTLSVHKRPVIAFFSTGDELVAPGTEPGPNQIVSANNDGLAALILEAGGVPLDLGIVPDDLEAIRKAADSAREADMLVTLGGASVGEHDLVREALAPLGLDVDFWKIAMRPGKPLMYGWLGKLPLLGLPGNPVSALVCAALFLKLRPFPGFRAATAPSTRRWPVSVPPCLPTAPGRTTCGRDSITFRTSFRSPLRRKFRTVPCCPSSLAPAVSSSARRMPLLPKPVKSLRFCRFARDLSTIALDRFRRTKLERTKAFLFCSEGPFWALWTTGGAGADADTQATRTADVHS